MLPLPSLPSAPVFPRRPRFALAAARWFCLIVGLFAFLTSNVQAQDGDWKEVSRGKNLVVSTRARAGSPIAEVRAVGRVDASPATVKAVLDDRDRYPGFMPYVSEVRVLSANAAARTLVAYMRLNPPLVGERDYTIAVRDETRPGGGFLTSWQVANEQGPAEKPGVVRVKVNEGSWLLEPDNGGAATRATYTLFTDAGGSVPKFVVNQANRRSLGDLFAAVRKTAADPKYKR